VAVLVCCIVLALSLTVVPAAPAQWIVVSAPAFRESLGPLLEHRRAEGMDVVVVQTNDALSNDDIRRGNAGPLRDRVHKLCRRHKGPSYVLLVGAVAGVGEDATRIVVPPTRGSVGRMRGEPTDSAYGCPGGGELPTVAVGRFPARTAEEARGMVAKTLHYEMDRRPGTWRRRLTVLAGIPAYNPVVDRLVEGLALSRFDRLDAAWTGRALYSNPQSRFGVPDERLHGRAESYVEDGQAFILYLGHSSARGLYGGRAAYLDREDWARLHIARGPGVLFTFGCNGCQLAGVDGEGYGVAAMRNPHGPAAVVGSHGICFAAMVQLGAGGLFERCFAGALPGRLADAWLAVEAGIARGSIDALTYRLLDAMDGDSAVPQAVQRQEHLEMFVLLGDPALRLPQVAADVVLDAPGPVVPGEALSVRGRLPPRLAGARVHVTLERPVSAAPAELEPVPAGPGRDRVMLANHERANDFVVTGAEVDARDGHFRAQLPVPDRLPWRRVVLRAYARTGEAEGLAVQALAVRRPGRP
jgi:hypothetical protein